MTKKSKELVTRLRYKGKNVIDVPAAAITGWQSGEIRALDTTIAESLLERQEEFERVTEEGETS